MEFPERVNLRKTEWLLSDEAKSWFGRNEPIYRSLNSNGSTNMVGTKLRGGIIMRYIGRSKLAIEVLDLKPIPSVDIPGESYYEVPFAYFPIDGIGRRYGYLPRRVCP